MNGPLCDDELLEHNRAEAIMLSRRKRGVLILLGAIGLPTLVLAPPDWALAAWIGILAIAIGCVGVVELRRFQLFVRDRRERRNMPGQGDAKVNH